ncbi:substrate binding domain-containing protein, partial [Acinetobacter baumannii]|nr:substrate binding domain-containing protein [Acinetobacter baumannii]
RILVASPSYLDEHSTPKNLKELAEHNCLKLTNVPYWFFEKNNQQTSLRVEGSFSSNNIEGIRELCIQGIGIAQLTLWDVKKELDEGTLVEIILEDVECQNLAVWALLPTNKYVPQRVNFFIQELKASFL